MLRTNERPPTDQATIQGVRTREKIRGRGQRSWTENIFFNFFFRKPSPYKKNFHTQLIGLIAILRGAPHNDLFLLSFFFLLLPRPPIPLLLPPFFRGIDGASHSPPSSPPSPDLLLLKRSRGEQQRKGKGGGGRKEVIKRPRFFPLRRLLLLLAPSFFGRGVNSGGFFSGIVCA